MNAGPEAAARAALWRQAAPSVRSKTALRNGDATIRRRAGTRPQEAPGSQAGRGPPQLTGVLVDREPGAERSPPSISSLERLCTALGVGPDALFAPADGDGDTDVDLRPTELGRDTDDWIARTLATAPPLTRRQAERISAALFGRAS